MTTLEGKVVAITGAASGIGLATSRLLASRGAAISMADVRQEPLEVAAREVAKSAPNVKIYHKAINVTKSDEVNAWLDETVKNLGGLHGAANLAGVLGNIGKAGVKDLNDEDWDHLMDVNLKGVFKCVRAELQRMEKDASIVNASSIAGLRGYGTGALYSVSIPSPSIWVRLVAFFPPHHVIPFPSGLGPAPSVCQKAPEVRNSPGYRMAVLSNSYKIILPLHFAVLNELANFYAL